MLDIEILVLTEIIRGLKIGWLSIFPFYDKLEWSVK